MPHCFVAYTIKGYGLPLAGHKDNHAGLMNVPQMELYKASQQIADGAELQTAGRRAGWRVSSGHAKINLRLLLQKLLPAGIVWGLQDRAGSLSIWRLCRSKNAKLIATL